MRRYHNLTFRALSDDARGVALLELALVTPLLLLLFVGTLEYSRVIRTKQAVGSFTRELSKTVARQCRSEIEGYDEENAAESNALLSACLGQYSGSAVIRIGAETLKVDVLASVYKWKVSDASVIAAGFSTGPMNCPVSIAGALTIECSSRASKLDAATVSARHGTALSSAGDLVFIETYLAFEPMAGNALASVGLRLPEVYTVGVS